MAKACIRCGCKLPLTDFYKKASAKDGLSTWCKSCCKEASADQRRRLKASGQYEAVSKAYRDRHRAKPGNAEKRRQEHQKNYAKNRAKILAQNRAYEIANRGAAAGRQRKRKERFVSWADGNQIEKIYGLAALATASSGVAHHVDHKIPLCGKHVSGLHVEGNLQILTWWENLEKHNKHEANYV